LEGGHGKDHKDRSLLDSNKAIYQKERTVREYAVADARLTLQESLCIEYLPQAQRNCVLDIGIGAGRTVRPLSERFKRYVGIDYSAPMIREARRRFPSHDLRVMDARKLDFTDAFDCAFFSYNGIDYMRFKERELAMRSICKALRRGGLLVFSTHNLHHARTATWMRSFFVSELRPPRIDRSWANMLLMRGINFWRQREARERGFASVNDPAHGFSILTLYVDIARQIRALQQIGFHALATIGNTKSMPGFDEQDCWVYIVAQRC
jgi:SAM-dependent methyltransferase